MLTRDRQLRTQIYQRKTPRFRAGLLLAHWFRRQLSWEFWKATRRGLQGIRLALRDHFPGVPLILEIQGFYQRQLLCPRWKLPGCFSRVRPGEFGVILVMWMFKMNLARLVIVFFGIISFVLVYISEELLRWRIKQIRPLSNEARVVLVGSHEDTARMRADLESKSDEEIEFVGELDLNTAALSSWSR